MRWTVLFVLCAAAASAKFLHNNNGLGRVLKTLTDFEDDLDSALQRDWNDDEDADFSDDDGLWSQTHYQQSRQKTDAQKRCPQCYQADKQQKWKQQQHRQEEDEFQDQEKRYYQQQQQQQQKWKQQQQHRQEEDEFQDQEERYYQQRQQQQQQQQRMQRRQPVGEEEYLYDSEDEEQYQRQTKQKKQRPEEFDDEPQQECKPNYQLLRDLESVNAQVAAKLHKAAKENNDDKNTLVSPVGVQLTLAALEQGARGDTQRQISQFLNPGMTKNQEQNAYTALAQSMKGHGPDQTVSKSANIKFSTSVIMHQQSARDQFIRAIKNCFDGEVKRCDFRQQPHQCRDQINNFLMNKMEQHLQHPLSPNSLTGNTKMIAISTMRVKANWGTQFKRNLKTAQGQFYPLGEKEASYVKILQTEGDFNHYEDNQMQILGAHTQDKQLTLYVILPKNRNGLDQVEKQRLQYGKQVQQLLTQCDSNKQTLKVQLPMFQAVHKMDTKHALRRSGVENAFDCDDADFTGISDEHEGVEVLKYGRRKIGGLEDVGGKSYDQKHQQQQLHLNKLIQQASIQINENGIDAAGGQFHQTGKQKQAKSQSEEESKQKQSDEKQFQVDRAFAFILKHNPTNQLLLIGRVVDASEQFERDKQEEYQ